MTNRIDLYQLNIYQKLAAATSRFEDVDRVYDEMPYITLKEARLVVAVLGLAGETGEVADLVKKHFGQGHPLPVETIAAELGDVLWYLSEVATALGLDVGDIAEKNIEKLVTRYPGGFSAERSLNRDGEGLA